MLDASNNRIAILQGSLFTDLPSLERVLLPRNVLKAIPSEIGSLRRLRILSLDDNALTSLPDSLGDLPALEELSCSNNQLMATSFPENIFGRLQKLRRLVLTGNSALARLPDSVGECTSLEEIYASSCGLSAVSTTMQRLGRLRILDLRDNKICAFPSEVLRGCTSLQILLLHQNPIQMEDLEGLDGFHSFNERRIQAANKGISKTGVFSEILREPADRSRLT